MVGDEENRKPSQLFSVFCQRRHGLKSGGPGFESSTLLLDHVVLIPTGQPPASWDS